MSRSQTFCGGRPIYRLPSSQDRGRSNKKNRIRRPFGDCQLRQVSYCARMLEPDYYKVLLEIKVGRRFWQSNPSAEDARTFYVRVVKPLRRLQRRGVVERLQEITASDDRSEERRVGKECRWRWS